MRVIRNVIKGHLSFKQECTFIGHGSGSDFGKWVATDCNSTHGFICARDVGESR